MTGYSTITDRLSRAWSPMWTRSTIRRAKLPPGCDNAWIDGPTYLFSEDPDFDPNRGSNQNWQQMQRQR